MRFFRFAWYAQVDSVAEGRFRLGQSREFSCRTKLRWQKVTTLSSALADILSYAIIASLLLWRIPNLLFEHVVDWSNKYNHGLGDYFACTVQSIVRCLYDVSCGLRGEKKQVCIVLLELNPLGRRPFSGIDLCFVWNTCSVQFRRYLFQRKQSWVDCVSMVVALYCTNVDNRFVSILTILHSGVVGRTTGCVNPIFVVPKLSELAQHLACLSKHDPIALPRRIHDNLYVVEFSWNAWRCFWI